MSTRGAVKPVADTARIIEQTAALCGMSQEEVRHVVTSMWMDSTLFMTYTAGYSFEVHGFGVFHIKWRKLPTMVATLENGVFKQLKYQQYYTSVGAQVRAKACLENANRLITRIILLHYSAKSYEKNVLAVYPYKPKVDVQVIEAAIGRLEQLLKVSLASYPITIDHPIQKVFVQELQKEGLLRHKIIDRTKLAKKPAKRGKV